MGIRSRGSTFFVALAVCAVTALVAVPASSSSVASASPASGAGPAVGKFEVFGAQHNGSALFGSRGWAGYTTFLDSRHPRTDFTLVKATWQQPAVRCQAAQAYTAFWVGFDGWFTQAVEQGGSYAWCPNAGAAPHYGLWWEMWPSTGIRAMFPIGAGDTIFASVKYVPASRSFTIYVKDVTTGKSFAKHPKCGSGVNCARTSAEVIAEDVAHSSGKAFYPLADYGAVTFKDAIVNDVNGHSGSISNSHWHNALINEAGPGVVLATTSALSPHGTAFKVTWRHS